MASPTNHFTAREGARNMDDLRTGLEASLDSLDRKLSRLRDENEQYAERAATLEEQNSALTALYVASQRLHTTLHRDELLLIVREIVSNLVGCEQYVLFQLSPDGWLYPVDSFGVDMESYDRVLSGVGLIGRTVETGKAYLADGGEESLRTQREKDLTACIPLKNLDSVAGALALFRLLPQKSGLEALDHQLFKLLESDLARALYCADLQRKAHDEGVAHA